MNVSFFIALKHSSKVVCLTGFICIMQDRFQFTPEMINEMKNSSTNQKTNWN